MVIDTSIAVAWCFEDESSPATDNILAQVSQEGGIVPPLWRYEIANALLTARKRKRLTETDAQRFLGLLSSLPLEVDADIPDAAALLAASQLHGLSAYDSAYLLLAQRHGLELATLDAPLAKAARAAGVSVVPG
ncbi:MAG: type II toxin-antitoxin system VapC family toxin [Propionibacteriaceae bacterium]|nr:type II toxin-antitoxin system VapC family toxin [Propionibacteriaceae bacterium]